MKAFTSAVKRLTALALLIALTISLLSCAKERSALELMEQFAAMYGTEATVYSKEVSEGSAGYVGEDFYKTLFGLEEEQVRDYAVVFFSDTFTLSECALILCKSEYGAGKVALACTERLELLSRTAALSGIRFPEGAFVKRYGEAVVMCALADGKLAERIFDKLL